MAFEISSHWGFMAGEQYNRDTAQAKESQETRLAQGDYEAAAAREAALEASAGAAPAAQAEVTRLQGEIAAVLAAAAAHMNPDCTPKKDGRGQPYTSRAAEHCGKLRPLQAELAKQEAIVASAAGYEPAKAAKAEAQKRLQAAAKPTGTSTDNTHPLFGSQSQIFGVDPAKMQARFLFISAISFSFLGAMVWVIVAALSTTRARASQPDAEDDPITVQARVEQEPPAPALPEEKREETPANFRLTHSQRTP